MQASPSRAIMMPLLPLSALALAAAAAPPVDPHCQARLDAWCNCAAHCSAGFPTHAPLAALHGRNRHNTSKAWRCYPVSELNADRSAFVPDPERSTDHICTEAERLPEQLKLCGKTPPAPSPACPTPAGARSRLLASLVQILNCTIHMNIIQQPRNIYFTLDAK